MKPSEVTEAGNSLKDAMASRALGSDEIAITAAAELLLGFCVNIAVIREHLDAAAAAADAQ